MNNLSWIEIIYWGATIIGGTLFLLRTILFLVGGGLDHDVMDADFHGEMPGDHDFHLDLDHVDGIADSDFSFKILSIQGVTAFFTMFGLIGLSLLRADLAIIWTMLGGSAAGLFAVYIISLLFSQLKKLQSDGSLKIQNAVGQKGKVYLTISSKGSGQVQLPVQGTLRILDAVSADKKSIKTGSIVQVTDVIDNKTLVVQEL